MARQVTDDAVQALSGAETVATRPANGPGRVIFAIRSLRQVIAPVEVGQQL